MEKGQVICIVEAMKLMNEIESDAAGEIVKCLVVNGQPIEYGQPLFSIRPVVRGEGVKRRSFDFGRQLADSAPRNSRRLRVLTNSASSANRR